MVVLLLAALVRVPATSNPYLAGMPNGTKSTYGDRAPRQSPVLVPLPPDAAAVSFSASGAANHYPACPPTCDGPEGGEFVEHQNRAEHGISNIVAPMNALLGVFLSDRRPDKSRAPSPLNARETINSPTVSPQLQQVFFIGSGSHREGGSTRFIVPRGATRLYLATMDAFEWKDNTGFYTVSVEVERSDVSSSMYSVESSVSFAKFACMPGRSRCTPERPIVEAKDAAHYHIVLPAHLEWGAAIAVPSGASIQVDRAAGVVCLDGRSRPESCNGPNGSGTRAGTGSLAPDRDLGALVTRTAGSQVYFSVNDRPGPGFHLHDGYFEFDVTVR